MTTVHFLEAPDKKPYSITIAGTNISCTAPCQLQGPAGHATTMVFRSGEEAYTKTIRIDGPEVNLQYRDHGSVLAGGLLLGFALPAGLAIIGIRSAATGTPFFADPNYFYDTHENLNKHNQCMHLSGPAFDDCNYKDHSTSVKASYILGSAVSVAMIITGSILIHRYRTRVQKSFDSSLNSLQLAIVPTREGFAAGAGFQF